MYLSVREINLPRALGFTISALWYTIWSCGAAVRHLSLGLHKFAGTRFAVVSWLVLFHGSCTFVIFTPSFILLEVFRFASLCLALPLECKWKVRDKHTAWSRALWNANGNTINGNLPFPRAGRGWWWIGTTRWKWKRVGGTFGRWKLPDASGWFFVFVLDHDLGWSGRPQVF